jgi:hypothetical protein
MSDIKTWYSFDKATATLLCLRAMAEDTDGATYEVLPVLKHELYIHEFHVVKSTRGRPKRMMRLDYGTTLIESFVEYGKVKGEEYDEEV